MRKTIFIFGLIFLASMAVLFTLQDIVMGLLSLIFVPFQVLGLLLIFLVIWQLYNS
ncbi:MAG: hypothetical protein ACTSRS_01780 [Candidatus Helarchaeota archaeon]